MIEPSIDSINNAIMIDIKWDVEGEEEEEVINLIMIMAEGEVEGEVPVPVEEGVEINYITRLDTIEAGADFNPDTAKEATVDISQVKEKGGKK